MHLARENEVKIDHASCPSCPAWDGIGMLFGASRQYGCNRENHNVQKRSRA
jgi:hypothetical protein